MKKIYLSIAAFGILLPYLARLPGVPSHGMGWLTSYMGDSLGGFAFFQGFNTLTWASVLIGVRLFRDAPRRFIWFPIVAGFALPVYAHISINLASSSTAALALIFIPIWSVPLTFIGVGVGKFFERRARSMG